MSSDLILIADGNLGRGRRVATALEAAGHRCEVTPDGAGALEIALVEYPRILVTQADLALVDWASSQGVKRRSVAWAMNHCRLIQRLIIFKMPSRS